MRTELLQSFDEFPEIDSYKNNYNARGLYDSMQFVLRLRYDVHKAIEQLPNGITKASNMSQDALLAYSTYLHETIHWWQHIGSISGFILSLSYPLQAHINFKHLKDYINQTGLIKSIKKYNELNATEVIPTSPEFISINQILNNFHDIEFFKHFNINSSNKSLMTSIINDGMYESIGHSYYITYASFISLLSSTFDQKMEFLPPSNKWEDIILPLRTTDGSIFHKRSAVGLTPIGLKELYEGQARFIQLQILYFGSPKKPTWSQLKDANLFSGVYYAAFEKFLELTDSKTPDSINDPLVALFLLVTDIAINPGEGFPFDVFDFENLINSVNPGIRFFMICNAICDKFPDFKRKIVNYSNSEYYEVSTALSKAILSPSPLQVSNEIVTWAKTQASLIGLMEEEKTFIFSDSNFPIRLLFARFIRYQQDKIKNPAFFCWSGAYMAGNMCSPEIETLFNEHQALFTDKSDKDVYPRTFRDKLDSNVQDAFNKFYAWVGTYDLCRQWIVSDGDFSYDFFWLTAKYSQQEIEAWSKHYFEQNYGVNPQNFTLV
jgi:hypothetical protein